MSVLEPDEPVSTVGTDEPRGVGGIASEAGTEGGWLVTPCGCGLPVDEDSTAGPVGPTAAVVAVDEVTSALKSADSVGEITDALLSADSVDEVSDTWVSADGVVGAAPKDRCWRLLWLWTGAL